jgi:MFS family permease
LFDKLGQLVRSDLYQAYTLRFADSLATNTLVFALPLMIYTATQSLAWSGLAFLIEWLPRLLSIPAAGPLVDRFGSKRIFFATNIARLVALITTFIIFTLQPGWWPILIAVGVVNGILGQVSFVAAEHLGVSVPTKKSAHHVQSVQVGIDQTVTVLGPMLAGLLLLLGNTMLFLGLGILTLISIFLAGQLRQTKKDPGVQSLSLFTGFRQGMTVIASSKTLQYVVLGTVAFNLLLAFITVMTPAIVKGQFHGTDGNVSILWTAGALLSIVAVGIASRIMTKTGIVMIGTISGIIASIAIAVASTASSFTMYAVCVALFIAMDGVYAVYIRTARAKIVPLEQYGVTVGVIVLLSLIPFPLAGLLVAVVTPSILPIILGSCTFVCFVITILSHIKIDQATLVPNNN